MRIDNAAHQQLQLDVYPATTTPPNLHQTLPTFTLKHAGRLLGPWPAQRVLALPSARADGRIVGDQIGEGADREAERHDHYAYNAEYRRDLRPIFRRGLSVPRSAGWPVRPPKACDPGQHESLSEGRMESDQHKHRDHGIDYIERQYFPLQLRGRPRGGETVAVASPRLTAMPS